MTQDTGKQGGVELLPCPFCEGDQTFTAPDRDHNDTTWIAGCKACFATVERDLEADAIAAWNTRPAAQPLPSVVEGQRLRPEVLAFAHLMETQLRMNDHKTGWKADTARALFSRLTEEAMELGDEIKRRRKSVQRTAREAADVANFAMMIADVSGALSHD